jgi:hypothetical protein
MDQSPLAALCTLGLTVDCCFRTLNAALEEMHTGGDSKSLCGVSAIRKLSSAKRRNLVR